MEADYDTPPASEMNEDMELGDESPSTKVGDEKEIGNQGLKKKLVKEGQGRDTPENGDEVEAHYTGTLLDGTKFDTIRDRGVPFKFKPGQDDDDDDFEDGKRNRLFGFMFGNIDSFGDLDVDYLDQDMKEHIAALANKLAPSIEEINLSAEPSFSRDAFEQGFDAKAEDAIDYEDIEEQYEGPETEASMEDDMLPEKEFFPAENLVVSLGHVNLLEEENYDEDENLKESVVLENDSTADAYLPGCLISASTEKERSSPDLLPACSLEAAELSLLVEDSQDESDHSLPLEEEKGTNLPILFVEGDMVVLRFSKIFGIYEPLRRKESRNYHHYSYLKGKHKTMDHIDIAEEDEEVFLRSSCQGHFIVKEATLSQDDESLFLRNKKEMDMGVLSFQEDGPHHVLYTDAQSENENLTSDLSFGWDSSLSPQFHPIDQGDWENCIKWDNISPESCETVEEFANSTEVGLETARWPTDVQIHGFPVSVEALGTTASPKIIGVAYHPQMLRLGDNTGNEELYKTDVIKRMSNLSLRNKDLLVGSWVDSIIWDSPESVAKPKLILDLQDEKLLFEIMDSKNGKHLYSHARAMVLTRSVKHGPGDSFDLFGYGGPHVGQFNISNDKYYSNRKLLQPLKSVAKKRTVHGVKIMHSVPALKLQTMKPKLSNKDIAHFHRPKAFWYPHDNGVVTKEQGKFSAQGPLKLILKSLGGKGSRLHVNAEDTVASVKAKAASKLDLKLSEKVKMFYSGHELQDAKSLAMQNVRPNSILHLVRTKIHLWSLAQKVLRADKPLRPPGGFKKKSDLSVKNGHVFLMEYCEERPLLLNNVGMGARLCTYYRKSGPSDQDAFLLQSDTKSVGNLITLDPADKSPFLGDIRCGCSQSSLETNMFRAPIFSHKLSSTDYLLVRSPKGRLSLRRIDKLYVVGQQEPHIEVISPGSKGITTYIGNRLLVYLYRKFRANEKPGFLPCTRADELSAQFPHLSESFLRKKLKFCADLQKGANGQLFWVMRRNFRLPMEDELRRMVIPEHVCAYESMLAGLYRLKHLGISRLTHPVGLTSAMNHLPDEAIVLAAASHIERELQITPWNLSSNFVACTNQDRESIERLEISGVGDPSGRGVGFSYVRLPSKAPIISAVVKKKIPVPRGGTTVTGTDADLRRLSMDAAREVLLKLDVPEDQIERMTRWHRIAMVRKLSSEQAASGIKVDATPASKYARGQRMSYLQLQQQTREKCLDIWDRQFQSLSAFDNNDDESESEANSDLDSFAGDLENLLDAEECEDGWEDNIEAKKDKADGIRGLKMRRATHESQVEEEIEDEAAEAAELCRMLMDDEEAEGKKKLPKPGWRDLDVGTESIKKSKAAKVVNHVFHSDGLFMSKEIIIPDPVEVENFLAKRSLLEKTKINKGGTRDIHPSGTVKKNIKTIADGFKVIKERKPDKPTREGFTCGACGQPGHMRTNKNCPKYGEDLELHMKATESETAVMKMNVDVPIFQEMEHPPTKKLTPKSMLKVMSAETLEISEKAGPKMVLPLKIKCSSEKSSDKLASDAEAVSGSSAKVSKIVFSNRAKYDRVHFEPHKVPFPPVTQPSEVEKEQPRKKLIIKQPKVYNEEEEVKQATGFGVDDDYKKTKRMAELARSEFQGKQDVRLLDQFPRADKKATEERRFWEVGRNRRSLREARPKRIYEERGMSEERRKWVEQKGFEELMVREKEKSAQAINVRKYVRQERRNEYQWGMSRYDWRIPERDRAAKRRPNVESSRYAADNGPQTKRRKGGEVALSNILESIVDRLKDAREISYLFLRPVSRKEAPNYLDIIGMPMDLSTIREKVRRMEYKSREDFRHDVWQITYNAHKYNDGRNPGIPPLADELLRLCDELLDENDNVLNEAESGIE